MLKNKIEFYGIDSYQDFLMVTCVSEKECEISEGAMDLVSPHGSSGGKYISKGNYRQVFIDKLKELYSSHMYHYNRMIELFETMSETKNLEKQELGEMLDSEVYDSYYVEPRNIHLKNSGSFSLENGLEYTFKLNKTENEYRLVATPKSGGETLEFRGDKNPNKAFYCGLGDLVAKIEEWFVG